MKMPVELDEQDLARIRAICSRFPDAEEALLQDRPLFHVRRRRFAIFNGDTSPKRRRWQEFGRSLHFAAEPLQRTAFKSDARISISPHHGFRGWLALDLRAGNNDWSEIERLLEMSYRKVAGREL